MNDWKEVRVEMSSFGEIERSVFVWVVKEVKIINCVEVVRGLWIVNYKRRVWGL